MKTIGVTEFRSNIKKYLNFANHEEVIIHCGTGISYAIVPLENVNDKPYRKEFVQKILQL